MYSYFAYNLCIQSDLALPELSVGQGSVDIAIRMISAPRELVVTDNVPRSTDKEALLSWKDIGRFHIRSGHEIVVEPAPGVAEQTLRLYILGPVLGVLLQQRGLLILHASAVAINGGAVVFLGESGWGKSTMAAALHAHGYGFVADDIVAIQITDTEHPITFPAFPRLKLGLETAIALGYSPDALVAFHPNDKRREYRVTEEFSQAALPLNGIYILAEGTHNEVEPLHRQDAFVELICHSYVTRHLDADRGATRHFRQCAALASVMPVYRLKRQLSISVLDDVARMVEAHLITDKTRTRRYASYST